MVTVARVRGSAPREVGARMVVTNRETSGSIGGGQLEYRCARQAAGILHEPRAGRPASLQSFPLGPDCGQCCGGVVDVLFEYIEFSDAGWASSLLRLCDGERKVALVTRLEDPVATEVLAAGSTTGNTALDNALQEILDEGLPATCRSIAMPQPTDVLLDPLQPTRFDVVLFGAGHVGSALVDVLARLDCTVYWIDSRSGMLRQDLPPNIRAMPVSDPVPLVREMPAESCYLVMTHSHPLDLALCEEILLRDDFAYCGLIGSQSKRNRFEKRLKAVLGERFDSSRLTCPIGVSGARGKKPAEIAIAVAAELLCVQSARLSARGTTRRERQVKLVGK
jgi:xanthine dehydrogenase accessory factor